MKRIAFVFLTFTMFLLQSCFDVVEDISLKPDGSGSCKIVLNMSRSKTKINSLMKMKKVNGHDVPTKEQIKEKVDAMEATIKKTSGISNVKTVLDMENYIATFSCGFSNVSSLNKAVKNIGDKEKNTKAGIDRNYEYDAAAKTFCRLNKFSLKNEYQQLSTADREIFATATYTGIFRFQADVAAATNADSKISGNKKAVMMKQNLLDIITDKKSIENKITLVK